MADLTIQQLKESFNKKTGMIADDSPADFSAFLFITNQSLVQKAIKRSYSVIEKDKPVSHRELKEVLSQLLVNQVTFK